MSSLANKTFHLQKMTQSILSLPTLPTVYARLIEALDSPSTNAKKLSELISEDQVLTAKLLKMCNSAYYGLKEPVTQIQRAIIVLGFESIKDLGLGLSVMNLFGSTAAQSGFDLAQFWQHSAVVGAIAKWLAAKKYPEVKGDAYVAGLLHDLGKVVLLQYSEEDFKVILQEAAEADRYLFEIEQSYLGVHHGVIGFWLGKKWRLADSVCDVMRFHHNPWDYDEGLDHRILMCVCLANLLSSLWDFGKSGNVKVAELNDQWKAYFLKNGWDVDDDYLASIKDFVDLEAKKSSEIIQLLMGA